MHNADVLRDRLEAILAGLHRLHEPACPFRPYGPSRSRDSFRSRHPGTLRFVPLFTWLEARDMAKRQRTPAIRLGTCSWGTTGWVGRVYAPGTPPAEFITQYAERFNTVEIDATFYAVPQTSTVDGWRDRTPDGFLFAAKAPQAITHEKFLVDCGGELNAFLKTLARLDRKLGPILLQFPYFARKTGVTQELFLERLVPFLDAAPLDEYSFVVEVRNKPWLNEALFEPLRERRVTLALIDHPWMPRPPALLAHDGLITGPMAYIRWLGERYGIEKITKTWGEPVIDRSRDLESWVPAIKAALDKQLPIFGYVNNHYSGHAPHDVALLEGLLGRA